MLVRTILAAMVSVLAGGALAQAPVPRVPLPKHDVLKRPDFDHRLVVKFADHVRARATVGGDVTFAPGAVGADELRIVDELHRNRGATFSRLIQLPLETLDFLERRALAVSGRAQPDLAGILNVTARDDLILDVARSLNALDAVEYVEFEEIAPPPPGEGGCQDISPATPLYHTLQSYHGANPGINMQNAWSLGNARGAGIRIADCEYGFVLGHEDLCDVIMEAGQTIHPEVISRGWDEHGTAVLGEMTSTDNAYGCRGLAPDAQPMFFTEWSLQEGFRRTTCIANAIASVDPGDIVVLEMQTTGDGGGYGPAELNLTVWTLTKNGTDAGILVVAAAGNGDQNLDSSAYASYRARGDSGAIIVGAGTSNTSHDKLSFSTYGARVNVQGWGHNVFTLGYGSYAQHGGDKNQRYTAGFSGTSSATPFIGATCAAIQSRAEAVLGRRLTPLEMRDLLIATGVPQGSGGHIGPLPDVQAAMLALDDVTPYADLVDLSVVLGSIVSGGLAELDESDDTFLRTHSYFGFSAIEANVMELHIGAITDIASPSTLDLSIESRLDNPNGRVRVRLRNWSTGRFEEVYDYILGMTETTEEIPGIDATHFVRNPGAGDGRIEVAIQQSVILTFSVAGFDSFFDWIGIRVVE